MKQIVLLIILSICLSSVTFGQIFEWAKGFGSDVQDEARSVTIDAIGNVYTTGTFRNTVDFDPSDIVYELTSAGGSDVYVLKTDPDGNLLWALQFGGQDWDDSWAITTDGNEFLYIVGNFLGTADFDPDPAFNSDLVSAGGTDNFIVKLNIDGGFEWAKSTGGISNEETHAVATDDFGNIYVGGKFQGTADFDPNDGLLNLTTNGSGEDIFLCKFDLEGNSLWAVGLGATGIDNCLGLTLDNSGNVIATGFFSDLADFDPGFSEFILNSNGAIDIYILKLDSDGNFIWVKSIGSVGWDIGYDVCVDEMDNICATGRFESSADFDTSSGITEITSHGEQDIYILKLNSDGNLLWAHGIGSNLPDWGQGIDVDLEGNLYITGFYKDLVDFDPGNGQATLTSVGGEDIFVGKYDPSGNHIWSQSMGGPNVNFEDRGQSIAIDPFSNVYCVGWFYETADFNPGVEISNIVSHGSFDCFIQKTHQPAASIENPMCGNPVSCHPNPFNEILNITLPNSFSDLQVSIIDVYGQTLSKEKFVSSQQIKMNPSLPNGIYFVRVYVSEFEIANFKVIKI